MWTYGIYNTVTGEPLLDNLTPSAASWTTRLSGGEGAGTFTFNLADLGIPQATIHDLLRPSARMIVVKWGTAVAYAGTPQPDLYKRDAVTVTASTVELRRLFRWRLADDVEHVISNGDLTVTSVNPAGAVNAILTRTMHNGGNWILPIDFPTSGSGTFTVTWPGADQLTINDMIADVEKDGSDVLFRPYLDSNGWLRWEALVGAPLSLGATDIPVTAPDTPISGLEVTEDGSEQITGVFVSGNGYGSSLLWTTADLIRFPGGISNIPIRDAYWQAKEIRDSAQLQRAADARFAEYNPVLVQWSFDLHVGDDAGDLSPAVVFPGRVLNMDVRGDPWIPDGVKTATVVALSGDMTSKVHVETR